MTSAARRAGGGEPWPAVALWPMISYAARGRGEATVATLQELGEQIGAQFAELSKAYQRASRLIRSVCLIGGALALAIAQGVEIERANGEFSAWTALEIGAAIIIALGSLFAVVTEANAAAALETARRAVDAARVFELKMFEFENERDDLTREIDRALQLYNSIDVMRGTIEQSLGISGMSPNTIIANFLKAASNSLQVAFKFETGDTWTICVYEAKKSAEPGVKELHCIAHARKIECDISQARKWRAGVGVGGVAFSTGNEIIIPDMALPEIGTIFDLKSNKRDYDDARYASMAAVPIRVGASSEFWGAAVVTSDRRYHFSSDADGGVSTSEPIRAIAAMAALAVGSTQQVASPEPNLRSGV